MTSTLASMDLREQLAALFLGNAPHEDTIGATAVEIPFYHRIAFSQSYYVFDCMAGLEVQLELSQLCCPLGDVARGVGVVQDRSQRIRGHYDNSVCLKVVAQFPRRNKYGIDKVENGTGKSRPDRLRLP